MEINPKCQIHRAMTAVGDGRTVSNWKVYAKRFAAPPLMLLALTFDLSNVAGFVACVFFLSLFIFGIHRRG